MIEPRPGGDHTNQAVAANEAEVTSVSIDQQVAQYWQRQVDLLSINEEQPGAINSPFSTLLIDGKTIEPNTMTVEWVRAQAKKLTSTFSSLLDRTEISEDQRRRVGILMRNIGIAQASIEARIAQIQSRTAAADKLDQDLKAITDGFLAETAAIRAEHESAVQTARSESEARMAQQTADFEAEMFELREAAARLMTKQEEISTPAVEVRRSEAVRSAATAFATSITTWTTAQAREAQAGVLHSADYQKAITLVSAFGIDVLRRSYQSVSSGEGSTLDLRSLRLSPAELQAIKDQCIQSAKDANLIGVDQTSLLQIEGAAKFTFYFDGADVGQVQPGVDNGVIELPAADSTEIPLENGPNVERNLNDRLAVLRVRALTAAINIGKAIGEKMKLVNTLPDEELTVLEKIIAFNRDIVAASKDLRLANPNSSASLDFSELKLEHPAEYVQLIATAVTEAVSADSMCTIAQTETGIVVQFALET
ncbi:hypothetical protein KA012_04280 [Candidatus Woesebacteria bacterium]|nr:hypothetical protein [Candidatus Woesebacteria bacterium]